jgi:hypothetical protein
MTTELESRGWEKGGSSSEIPATHELAWEAWHYHDRMLRLAHLRGSPVPNGPSFATFYEVAIIGQGIPE